MVRTSNISLYGSSKHGARFFVNTLEKVIATLPVEQKGLVGIGSIMPGMMLTEPLVSGIRGTLAKMTKFAREAFVHILVDKPEVVATVSVSEIFSAIRSGQSPRFYNHVATWKIAWRAFQHLILRRSWIKLGDYF